LVAFITFLLVALSSPIIKSIYILKVTAIPNPNQPPTSIATYLWFGVYGFCASSVFDGPDQFDECFGPKIGYTIPSDLINLIGLSSSIIQIVLQGLFVVLVLHPISAGLSFLTFVNSLFLGSHSVSIAALFFAIVTALLTTVIFVIDLVIVLVAKSKIGDITVAHLTADFGNAIWMVLVAVIVTWTAVVLLSARACYCCGVRRKVVIIEEKPLVP
jgi:hypothetical protein